MGWATFWALFPKLSGHPDIQSRIFFFGKTNRNCLTGNSICLSSRVTRLGEFLPNGRLISFGSFFNYRSGPNFRATFFYGKSCVFILAKNRLGYILGDFFTYTSGHPVKKQNEVTTS
jgi:hypothetical protein